MNPLFLLLPVGLVVYFLSSKDRQGPPDKKAPENVFVPKTEDYSDKNNVVWELSNPSPGLWKAKVKNDPKGYPGYERAWDEAYASTWQPQADNRANLVNKIDFWLTTEAGDVLEKGAKSGEEAGTADANDSIQAYKDSVTGLYVHPKYGRWDNSKNQAWKDAYNRAFDMQLTRKAYYVVSEGPCCDKWYIKFGVKK